MEKKILLPKKNAAYVIMVLFFLIKGIIYGVFITPPYPGTSPDDPGQISYVIYIAKEHRLPLLHETKIEATVKNCISDYARKDFNSFSASKNTYNIGIGEFESCRDVNWIVQHPPLYYLFLLPFYMISTVFTRSLPAIIIVMRMATLVFLGCGTLICLIKILDLLAVSGIAKKCILIAFLFSPAIQYFLVMIDNDAMVIFLAMLSFYLFFKYLKEGSLKALYGFSVVCGCIMITKYTGGLILPAYAIMYLYHALHIKKTKAVVVLKQAVLCILLFGIVVAPVYLRNYASYQNIMPVFDSEPPIYDYSFRQFITESTYIQEIYRHIVCVLGYERMIGPPIYMRCIWALFLFLLFLSCIWKNKERNTYILSCIIGILLCKVFLNINFYIGLAISAIVGIFFYKLLNNRKNREFEIVLLSVLTICITVAIFIYKHYGIYIHRGHPGATHGRYYYTLIFPFFYLIFGELEKIKAKQRRAIPAIFVSILLVMEAHMQYLCLKTW